MNLSFHKLTLTHSCADVLGIQMKERLFVKMQWIIAVPEILSMSHSAIATSIIGLQPLGTQVIS